FATRLCSEGMRAYKHKDYDLYLFEMYFGIAYAPYWCSVVYSPYSDDEKAELFVSNHGFEQREAKKFYSGAVTFCSRKSIRPLRRVLGMEKMTLHREPIWLEKSKHGT